MDATAFLQNLETTAEAPGGLQRLRLLVLDRAVRGLLVAQVPTDRPASISLSEVRAEKGETLATSIRGGDDIPRVPRATECLEETPPGWCWARIDDTGEYVNGLAFKNADWQSSGTPIVRIQNLTNPDAPFNYAKGPFPEDRTVQDGDILVSWSATLNAFRWNRGTAAVNQHIFKVIPDPRVVTTDYLFHLLRHSIRTMAASEAAHGLVMNHINRGPFLSYVVPIPPLAEQARIVAKVDELMGLCDELEARQHRRGDANRRFRISALHALTGAETPDDPRSAWDSLSENWASAVDNRDAVGEIRCAIFQLAISGRLVPQLAEDEPATSLFGGRCSRPGDVISSGRLPVGWTWARFSDVAECRLGKMLDKGKNVGPYRSYLRNANVQWFRIDVNELFELRLEDKELEACSVRIGDLVICEGGEPGRAAVCDDSVDGMVIQKALHRARPHPGIDPWYLAYFLRALADSESLVPYLTGATIKHLTGRSLSRLPVPVPPAAEQKRIVAKVELLLSLCENLDRALGSCARARESVVTALTRVG